MRHQAETDYRSFVLDQARVLHKGTTRIWPGFPIRPPHVAGHTMFARLAVNEESPVAWRNL